MYSIIELRTIINNCHTTRELTDIDAIVMEYEESLEDSVIVSYLLIVRWRYELLTLTQL